MGSAERSFEIPGLYCHDLAPRISFCEHGCPHWEALYSASLNVCLYDVHTTGSWPTCSTAYCFAHFDWHRPLFSIARGRYFCSSGRGFSLMLPALRLFPRLRRVTYSVSAGSEICYILQSGYTLLLIDVSLKESVVWEHVVTAKKAKEARCFVETSKCFPF
jgi:hypothetical protein